VKDNTVKNVNNQMSIEVNPDTMLTDVTIGQEFQISHSDGGGPEGDKKPDESEGQRYFRIRQEAISKINSMASEENFE
jgi:hypothetical protein